MKKSIKKFPGNVANLTEGKGTAHRANRGKVGNSLACLVLIMTLTCLYNQRAAGLENVELFPVKERPVKAVAFHKPGEADRNGVEIIRNQKIGGHSDNFIAAQNEELKATAPEQKTLDRKINTNQYRRWDSRLDEFNANVVKLHNFLLAFFIPAVIFLVGCPVILFWWGRKALEYDRRLISSMIKFKLPGEK